MKQYLFILGHQPHISIAEIKRVADGAELVEKSDTFAVFNIDKFSPEDFAKLGGAIKYAEVKRFDFNNLHDEVNQILGSLNQSEKIHFGISGYEASFNADKLGMQIKGDLKRSGAKVRFVQSKDEQLSAVVVAKNKLLTDQGCEIVIAANKWIGKTLAVQDFESFAKRDYKRPAFDDVSGMLPPKLARIMVNLSGKKLDKDTVLLDPFCGSGTVLLEAAMLGAGKVIGTDLSAKAVEDAQENIEWLVKENRLDINYSVEQVDATELEKRIAQGSIDLIVTEPFLGDPVKKALKEIQAKERLTQLQGLYRYAIMQMNHALKPDGRVVMVFPFIDGQRMNVKELIEDKFEIELGGLDYKRPKQYIGREIYVFKKL